MIVSLNEVEGMAAKAFSGAGRPWGLAQEAGWAVAQLEATGGHGAASLVALLRAVDGIPCDRLRPDSTAADTWRCEGSLCPVTAGVFIADRGGISQPLALINVHVPRLLRPFVGGCEMSGDLDSAICPVLTITAGRPVGAVAGSGPVDIADEIWEALCAYAHRTYVPATEQSRLKGAGAGLTDND